MGKVDDRGAGSGGGDFSDGGDAGGADRSLGNTDNYDLSILTNNLERLYILSSGKILIGHDTSLPYRPGGVEPAVQMYGSGAAGGLGIGGFSADGSGPAMFSLKSRSATIGGNGLVQNGDVAFAVTCCVDDGTDYHPAVASVTAVVDGVAAENDTPGRIAFATTAAGAITPTEQLRVDSAGDIYLYNLGTLSGQADVQYNTSTKELGYVSSSQKYKKNIREEADTSWIHNITVKTYDRKDDTRNDEVGLIAEELELIRPDLCAYNEDGEVETYSNSSMVPFLIKEIQELRKEIDELKTPK